MSLESGLERWNRLDPWIRTAVVVWALAVFVVCVRSGIMPRKQSVYPTWLGAGHDWRTSHDLYEEGGDYYRFGYRYGPLVAAGFTVFDLVPEGLGNVGWRLINGAAFLAALVWWLRTGAPLATTPRQRGMFYLMNVPLALGSLNNGQANLLLAALMLAGVTAIVAGRWNLSAVCMAFAVVLKIYPLAMVLLLCVAYPRKYPLRFLAALAAVCAMPFLMQHPEYVVRQYHLWWLRVHHADSYRRYWPIAAGYRDIWLLIRVWKLPINLAQYTGMQLAGGGVCAVLCGLTAWRGWPDRQRTLVVLSLATAWMMLLGPSSESCTFVLVSPAVVWWLFQTRFEQALDDALPGRPGVRAAHGRRHHRVHADRHRPVSRSRDSTHRRASVCCQLPHRPDRRTPGPPEAGRSACSGRAALYGRGAGRAWAAMGRVIRPRGQAAAPFPAAHNPCVVALSCDRSTPARSKGSGS